jgi:hypothetical protein
MLSASKSSVPLTNTAFGVCLLLLALLIGAAGCDLEPNPETKYIAPRVLNYSGFRIKQDNGVVPYGCVNEFPASLPDPLGFLHLEDVSRPYNLNIYEAPPLSIPFVFMGLNETYPIILIPKEYGIEDKSLFCELNVNFPAIEANKVGILKFISNELFYQDSGTAFANVNTTSRRFKVYFPAEMPSISGKLIFLEGVGVNTIRIQMSSYDNFGMKDVTLHPGTEDITFTPQEILSNPGDTSSTLLVTCPPEYIEHNKVNVYLNFPGYSANSEMLITQLVNFNFPLTAKLPLISEISNYIRLESFYDLSFAGYFQPLEVKDINPGEQGTITHTTLELTSPPDNETGVEANTYLSVSDNLESGIYFFYIASYYPTKKVLIVTDKNSIRWGDLNFRDFKTSSNTNYSWYVTKLTTFNSIKEFTEKPYIFDEGFNAVSISNFRNFKTAP